MAVSTHFEFFYELLNRRFEDMDILFSRKFDKSVIKRFIYRREHVER